MNEEKRKFCYRNKSKRINTHTAFFTDEIKTNFMTVAGVTVSSWSLSIFSLFYFYARVELLSLTSSSQLVSHPVVVPILMSVRLSVLLLYCVYFFAVVMFFLISCSHCVRFSFFQYTKVFYYYFFRFL